MSARRYRYCVGLIAMALPFVPPIQAAAQTGVVAAAGVRYESYSFASPATVGASSVNLLAAPFAARATLARGLTLAVSGAMARATVQTWGGSYTLSGLTDTELRATGSIESGRTTLALAAVGTLPSGHASLSLAETVVAGTVASDLLPFAISQWGSGGGGGVELAAVQGMEGGSVGVSASYRVARDFRPFDAVDLAYRPGNELRVGGVLARTLDDDRTLAFQVAYSRFGEDQLEGRGWLRTGQRVLALGSYAAPVGSGTLSAHGGVLYRSGGALAQSLVYASAWDVLARLAPPSETLFLLGTSARVPWRARVLVPSADFRLLRRGDGTAQGFLLGVGGSAELPLGEGGVRLVPSARLRLGRLLVAEGAASGVRGFEVGLGLEFGGAR